MKRIMEYGEYSKLFDDELVCAVRLLLEKIEDDCGGHDVEDSEEHNTLIRYFNKFALHKKITETQLKNW